MEGERHCANGRRKLLELLKSHRTHLWNYLTVRTTVREIWMENTYPVQGHHDPIQVHHDPIQVHQDPGFTSYV